MMTENKKLKFIRNEFEFKTHKITLTENPLTIHILLDNNLLSFNEKDMYHISAQISDIIYNKRVEKFNSESEERYYYDKEVAFQIILPKSKILPKELLPTIHKKEVRRWKNIKKRTN